MKRIPPAKLALAVALLAAASACTTTTTNAPTNAPGANTNVAATNSNSTTNSNANASASPSPSPSSVSETGVPVTLPALDALFSDSTFAGALKAKLQLTNEQIEGLRKVAREGTAKLSEKEAGSGSTSEAARDAEEKIKGVIGDEKTAAFMAFVRERWSGGDGALPSKPNSVPTDTRIVVNAPAFRMDVFENGQLTKTYRIGIGYPEFPLPQGVRKAEQIIFNPTWTPPDEPWVRGRVQPGEVIPAGSGMNPLGPLKIPIGAPSLIHGGKQPSRLGQFASHGCVGLTNSAVQDFALVLAGVSGTQLTPAQVAAYAQKRDRTQAVKLSTPVPVELRYETIVVQDGQLHIYRDVYDKGTDTEENLRNVLGVYGVRLEDLSEQERSQALDALQQMAHDAHGNPSRAADAPLRGKSKTGGVTYNVKGEKEVVIDIAALRGKGYPAPVNLTPPAPQPQAAPAKKKK
ncbi:MAG TPA: L,D-transpeptidase family protein [Pyrinomonadaceae bacterium]|nr:L,D-transpeptidase family protein [Pyrinomonadaceae bacterium]